MIAIISMISKEKKITKGTFFKLKHVLKSLYANKVL